MRRHDRAASRRDSSAPRPDPERAEFVRRRAHPPAGADGARARDLPGLVLGSPRQGVDGRGQLPPCRRPVGGTAIPPFPHSQVWLKWAPDGARLEGSDSVFITLTIDSLKLSVDFQPSGVVFSDVLSAGLVVCYVNANPDLNGDGVVDSTDQMLEGQLALSEEPTKVNGWFKLATKNDTTQKYVATDEYHFSQYAVSW